MLLLTLLGFTMVTAINGAPTSNGITLNGITFNSTKWTPEHILQPDQVILHGEGRMEVVHESVYRALLESQGVALHRIPVNESAFYNITNVNETSAALGKRDCIQDQAVVIDITQSFVDWDLQMSQVVVSDVPGGMDVYVTAGYTVSNSITVSAGVEESFLKSSLGISLGIDYSRTWTTQTAIEVRGNVPNGYSGVMITKPNTVRRYGRVLQGCLGSMTATGTYMADSHAGGSYGGIAWISGATSMCVKREYPLTRCEGSGQFV